MTAVRLGLPDRAPAGPHEIEGVHGLDHDLADLGAQSLLGAAERWPTGEQDHGHGGFARARGGGDLVAEVVLVEVEIREHEVERLLLHAPAGLVHRREARDVVARLAEDLRYRL